MLQGLSQTRILQRVYRSREHRNQIDYAQTDVFKNHRPKRFAIEAKNNQLKNTHGLSRNKTSDLKGMMLQSAMNIVAFNLKRIITSGKKKQNKTRKKDDWSNTSRSNHPFFSSRSDKAKVFSTLITGPLLLPGPSSFAPYAFY